LQQLEGLLEEALATDDRIEVLSALLDQNVPVHISSSLLLNWLENTSDQVTLTLLLSVVIQR
jgi:16S rRNA A1518/A1519 N6-dimethyltransferase RsmA/KsgA/DIM1 with predicted DNA glycosylase/AP lyase activity